MTEQGKNILIATREIRQLFENVSLLLLTSTDLMTKAGWVPYGNVATAGGSQSINFPSYWMPQDVFRFFTHKEKEHLISFVSVIFDDLNDPVAIEEPLISAGWLDYGKGNKVGNKWGYGIGRIVLKAENWSANGAMLEIPTDAVIEKHEWTIQRARALALPLIDIVDASSINNKVIECLLNDMKSIE